MTIFNTNFSNPLSRINDNLNSKCYWIVYKPLKYALNCDGKDFIAELPVAPEKIDNLTNSWWAANQHLVKSIIPCDKAPINLDESGRTDICVISPVNSGLNTTSDCVSLYPDEQQLLEFLQNNDCDLNNPAHPVLSWLNNILNSNTKLRPTQQKFFRSFENSCNNCNIFDNNSVSFSEYVSSNYILHSQGTNVSGNSVLINNTNINIDNYFNTNLLPIVSYSKDTLKNKIMLSNSEADINFIIPQKLGFDTALLIDKDGNLSSQSIVPGQVISLSDTVILGSSSITGINPGNKLPPSPPTVLSFRSTGGSELPARTVISIAPNQPISTEDMTVSYAFRFNGTAIRPRRIGPADAVQDESESLSANEYEFEGFFDGQYVTVASIGSNSIGPYGDAKYLGVGCCYISDGSIISGSEETCQEYTADSELSYSWAEENCDPSGCWLTGSRDNIASGLFYANNCVCGTYSDWLSDYTNDSSTVASFRQNINCATLSSGNIFDNFVSVPTGNNIDLVVSPDITLNFDKILSSGSVLVSYSNNTFSFSTTAETSGNIGFIITKPSTFSDGQEIISYSDNNVITSVPFVLDEQTITCSNIFANNTYYDPAQSGFVQAYSSQDYVEPAVIKSKKTVGIFQFAPSGCGSVAQFGQHQINQFHAHPDQIYFTDAKSRRVDLSRYVSTSYLSPVIYPEPVIIPQSNNEEFSALVSIDPTDDFRPPNDDNIDFPLSSNLLEYPCENPFYIRGGYNIHDLFTFECGCWTILVTRKEALDIAITIATLLIAISRLYKLLSGILGSIGALQSDIFDLNTTRNLYLGDAARHRAVCDSILNQYPDIWKSFPPDGGLVLFPGTDMNPSTKDIVVFPIDGDIFNRISWEEYVAQNSWNEEINRLNDMYEEWQRYQEESGYAADAEGKARGLLWNIEALTRQLAAKQAEKMGIEAELYAAIAALALWKTKLDEFMNGPAFTEKYVCNPGFDFCKWNATYEVCGGTEEPRAYWQKGYSPDGVRLTMPEGWPSCDCCHPCEACADPAPETGWGTAASSPCQTCPDGYTVFRQTALGQCGCEAGYTYWPEGGINGCCEDGLFFETGHGCWDGTPGSESAAGLILGPVCCPPVSTLGVFGYSGPYFNENAEQCRYIPSDPTQPELTIDYEKGKRCCDGECIDYCEDC